MATEVLCRRCPRWTLEGAWRETETCCEDCGSHTAWECPHCGAVFDGVFEWDTLARRSALMTISINGVSFTCPHAPQSEMTTAALPPITRTT